MTRLHDLQTPALLVEADDLERQPAKALGMDHGNPRIDGAKVWFCSDEHVTFAPERNLRVGDRLRVWPAHVDSTVAYHERLHVVSGEDVLEAWEVDLRGW